MAVNSSLNGGGGGGSFVPNPTNTVVPSVSVGIPSINNTPTAAATVDLTNTLVISSAFANGNTLRLPAPTAPVVGQRVTVTNETANTCQILPVAGSPLRVTLGPQSSVTYVWTATGWLSEFSTAAGQMIQLTDATSRHLRGVDFTLTVGDPLRLTTSLPATGFIMSQIWQISVATGGDAWISGTLPAAGVFPTFINRGSAWNAETNKAIGIVSPVYSCQIQGALRISGRTYTINGATSNGSNVVTVTCTD